MFEDHKERKEKRSLFGMSKAESIKVLIMVFVFLLCLVFLIYYLGDRPAPKPGTEVNIPGPDTAIEPGRLAPGKFGDKGAVNDLKKLRDELIKKRDEQQAEDFELPPIPKPPTAWEPDPDVWKQVRDDAIDVLEEPAICYALHQLNSMTPEEIDAGVELFSSDAAKHPEEYRGKFVSITGTLMTLENAPLPENRSGLNQIWWGLIYNQRHKKIFFYIFDKDREWFTQDEASARGLTRRGDLVTLNGVFFKMYRNHTERNVVAVYPFMIGRRLKLQRAVTASESYPWQMLIGVGVILGGVFALFFVLTHRDRHKGDAFLHSRKYKKASLVSNEAARAAVAKARGKPVPGQEPEVPSGGQSAQVQAESGTPGPENKPENTI